MRVVGHHPAETDVEASLFQRGREGQAIALTFFSSGVDLVEGATRSVVASDVELLLTGASGLGAAARETDRSSATGLAPRGRSEHRGLMSLWTLSPNDYRRLAKVLQTLAPTAARPVLVQLGLLRGAVSDEASERSAYEAFVAALEALGPTFVKLGQIMATRSDLLPPELTERLGRLHDDVAPVPFEQLREQLTIDLGARPEELFAEFSSTAIAAASIAQVYACLLYTSDAADE